MNLIPIITLISLSSEDYGNKNTFIFKSYGFSITLILSIIIGAILGIIYKKMPASFKPLGDIFLNLLFTVLIPLVFFPFLPLSPECKISGDWGKLCRL